MEEVCFGKNIALYSIHDKSSDNLSLSSSRGVNAVSNQNCSRGVNAVSNQNCSRGVNAVSNQNCSRGVNAVSNQNQNQTVLTMTIFMEKVVTICMLSSQHARNPTQLKLIQQLCCIVLYKLGQALFDNIAGVCPIC